MIEALACGTPVIATPYGAAPELIEHGVTGYLAATPQDLRRAVTAIDRLDRGACRHQAEQRFTAMHMAHHHDAFYRSVIHNRANNNRANNDRPNQ
jgi:glycosyltransferase involved in cell wall biosynthesis